MIRNAYLRDGSACLVLLMLVGTILFFGSVWTAPQDDLDEFLTRLQSDDAKVRREAWENAGPYGVRALAPSVNILAADDGSDKANKDEAKTADCAVARIVHHALTS